MSVLALGLGERSYQITIKKGCLEKIGEILAEKFPASRYCIVSDDTVTELYGRELLERIRAQGLQCDLLSFGHGEANKNLQTVGMLASSAAQLGLDRKSMFIALGGGVTGDITGFLASSYMRGIPCLQIPTTLLAQVDSSVGGKTGVDIPEGKNLFGSFSQPAGVYIDPDVLSSLPEEQYLNGLAEVIKHGIIRDRTYFDFLRDDYQDIMALEPDTLRDLIHVSCKIKAEVVAEDEQESNIRQILNFGHTIGHAVEAASSFAILHGFAVSIGMVAAARLAVMNSLLAKEELELIVSILEQYRLPTEIPIDLDRDSIRSYLLTDKKRISGITSYVLPTSVGKVVISKNITQEQINAVLDFTS